MKIEDLEGLEEGACECYEIVEEQFDLMYGRPWREMAEEQHASQAGSSNP